MVALGVDARALLDLRRNLGAGLKHPLLHHHPVDDQALHRPLGVEHHGAPTLPAQAPAVADLAAGLRVERRRGKNHLAALPGAQLVLDAVVADQCRDLGRELEPVVAPELRADPLLHHPLVLGPEVGQEVAAPRRLAAPPLLLERGLEARAVDRQPLLLSELLEQLRRNALALVEIEHRRSGHDALPGALEALELALCDVGAAVQRAREALLLLPELGRHHLAAGDELREDLAHLLDDHRQQGVEEGAVEAELAAVAQRAPDDAPQHVAPALVRGHHAVAHQEGRGTQVVGDHPERRRELGGRVVRTLRQLRDGLDQGQEEVGLVVRAGALKDRRETLEAGAGVDRGPRQGVHGAGRVAVELHEDEVPDLDDVVALAVDQLAPPRRQRVGTAVEVDLGAGAAGAGLAHRPEVVPVAEAQDAVGRRPHRLPQPGRVVVVGVDREPEPVQRQPVDVDHELPRELNGLAFEVVAEGEVAQHLEEGVVAGGVADVLEVVVLAARAHALLGRAGTAVGPLLAAGEHVLELVHAGVGEQQRAVAGRQQGRRGHHLVALGGEVVEESLPDFPTGHRAHGRSSPGRPPASRRRRSRPRPRSRA